MEVERRAGMSAHGLARDQVVEVRVSRDDGRDGEVQTIKLSDQLLRVATGVDDDDLFRAGIADDVTIAAEWADDEVCEQRRGHGVTLERGNRLAITVAASAPTSPHATPRTKTGPRSIPSRNAAPSGPPALDAS